MADKERDPSQPTDQVASDEVSEMMARNESRKASFVVLDGMEVGRVIPVGVDPIVFGRDADCTVMMQDDSISRRHAEVTRGDSGEVVIRDLGSTNGTFVSGSRVDRVVLQDGDKVLIGRRTFLKFALQDALEQEYQEQMYEGSTRDALTGAYNRKHFNQKLTDDLSFASRHNLPLSLLIFDIDHFKQVNDTHGHPVGDRVLVHLARAVQETIRAEDMLARYGGEEFVIIASGIDAAGGRAFAERLRARVAEQRIPMSDQGDETLSITVSVGAATVAPGGTFSAEAVVAAADANLYTAKEQGRDRVVVSEL